MRPLVLPGLNSSQSSIGTRGKALCRPLVIWSQSRESMVVKPGKGEGAARDSSSDYSVQGSGEAVAACQCKRTVTMYVCVSNNSTTPARTIEQATHHEDTTRKSDQGKPTNPCPISLRLLTHLRGHVILDAPRDRDIGIVGGDNVAPDVQGIVRINGESVGAATDLIRVAGTGHVADAGAIRGVSDVVATPTLF